MSKQKLSNPRKMNSQHNGLSSSVEEKLANIRERRKLYYQTHREKLLQYQKAYIASHPELVNRIKEKRKFRYATDPTFREKRKQYNKKYFLEHPEAYAKSLKRLRERYQNDPDFRNHWKQIRSVQWSEKREMKKNETIYLLILANFERLSPNYQTLVEQEIKKRNAVLNNQRVKTKEKPVHKYN